MIGIKLPGFIFKASPMSAGVQYTLSDSSKNLNTEKTF